MSRARLCFWTAVDYAAFPIHATFWLSLKATNWISKKRCFARCDVRDAR